MKEMTSISPECQQCIIALLPEFQHRYEALKTVLQQAAQGLDVNISRLWLAQGDLMTVMKVMTGADDERCDEYSSEFDEADVAPPVSPEESCVRLG